MPVPDLRAIAAHYGGEVPGRECLIPSPGHGRQDRGTAIRLAPGASDGVTVHCFNGEWREAKDMLRRDGFLPASDDARPRELTPAERAAHTTGRGGTGEGEGRDTGRSRRQGTPVDRNGQPCRSTAPLPCQKADTPGTAVAVWRQAACPHVRWDWQAVELPVHRSGRRQALSRWRAYGGLFWYAGQAGDRLAIGEGMATMAAVRRATGHACARRAAALAGADIAFPELSE